MVKPVSSVIFQKRRRGETDAPLHKPVERRGRLHRVLRVSRAQPPNFSSITTRPARDLRGWAAGR